MSLKCYGKLEISLFRLHPSRNLRLSKGRKNVQSAIRPPKNSFITFKQVSFWAGQDTEHEVNVFFDHLKNRFFHFTQVAFWAGQEAENEFNLPWEHV